MARQHSKLGASSASRWMACPGSVALCATLPAAPETIYAREGSAAHELGELWIRADLAGEPFDPVNAKLVEFADIKITKGMIDAVRVYRDFVVELRAEQTGHANDAEWVEAGFALIDFDAELFGHNDFMIYNGATGVLHVVDYKHGAGVAVEIEGNKQLRFYGLGGLMSLPGGCREVRTHVVQPRVFGRDPVQTAIYEPLDLIEFGADLATAAAATRAEGAPLASGDHCRWCAAKAVCPRLYDDARAAAEDEFGQIVEPTTLDAVELGRRLELAKALRQWLTAIEAHGKAEAMHGRTPLGFKLVSTSGHRSWRDPDGVADLAARHFGEPAESFFEKKLVSPSQLEKRLGKKVAADFVNEHGKAGTNGYALAPASDRRKAVEPPSDADFSEIIGELEYDG